MSISKDVLHRRADRQRRVTFAQDNFGATLCGMYGTTEVGVILGELPRRGGFHRQARFARQAGAGCSGGGAGPGRDACVPGKSARSRSGAMTHGSRPRTAATWTGMVISIMPAGPTT